ncbi:MAG: chemotaxis protein CheW, partial [Anaerolineae bacterium]|nr:chemotaxis protein CheW [Anaerolineae bacterium]
MSIGKGASGEKDNTVQLLTFKMGDQEFALNLDYVAQIVRVVSRAPAQAPDFVEGMFNLRGKSIPVVDIRKAWGLPAKSYEPGTLLLIARANSRVAALIVDAVSDVLSVPLAQIEPRPAGAAYVSACLLYTSDAA